MKILIIADEVWNDDIFSSNILSNWFTDFDVELAEIYCSPGTPKNNCCELYFQITDRMMFTSLFGKRAGLKFCVSYSEMYNENSRKIAEQLPKKFYHFMKSISTNGLLAVRDIIWLCGRYDKVPMQEFINDFNPDLVFCPRLLTPKLLRLERIIASMTNSPFVAFTADDEESLKQISYSPIYWIRRLLFRQAFKKHVNLYKHYFTFSQEQAKEYNIKYELPTSTLYKSGNFDNQLLIKVPNSPIKLVYAGRMYCNRWKTLAAIGNALKEINVGEIKMTLDIFTQEKLTKKQLTAIAPNEYVRVNGSVTLTELDNIYKQADIALHVESLDKKYRYATRFSFSTKIIDLMGYSCSIFTISWEKHAGFQYLKKYNAAFCISEYINIKPELQNICNNPELIQKFALNAWNCGKNNHSRKIIHSEMLRVFKNLM